MKRLIVFAVVCLLAAPAALQAQNELTNGCYYYGSTAWDVQGSVLFNGNGTDQGSGLQYGRPHIAYTAATGAPTGKVSQLIDDTLSPGWNPNYNQKEFHLTGWYYTGGQKSITLYIGWWTHLGDPKPTPASTPDFSISNALAKTNGVWTTFDWSGVLNYQPQWIRVTVELTSSKEAVDTLVFTSQCVPEPGGLLALASGLAALAGFTIRRRRS